MIMGTIGVHEFTTIDGVTEDAEQLLNPWPL